MPRHNPFVPGEQGRRADHGLFGPGSVTWEVWSHPTVLIGVARAIVVEMLEPHSAAGLGQHTDIHADPRGRLDRTLTYFLAIAFADGPTVAHAADALMRVHRGVTGIDPVTGRRYQANNPHTQLWVHITAWHSILYCYEKYGPGSLDADREAQYWEECAVAAEFQTFSPDLVPRTREGVREYFAAVRPSLCISEQSRELIRFFLYPPLRRDTVIAWLAAPLVRTVSVATLPRYVRRLAGIDQSPLLDTAIRPFGRAFAALAQNHVPRSVSPTAAAIQHQAFGEPPVTDRTVCPTEARQHPLPVASG